MTKYLIIGDLHGNHIQAKRDIDVAVEYNIDTLIQLGDFGLWPGNRGEEFLNIVSRYLVKKNKKMIWLPGNHEDWNQIDQFDMSKVNEDGHLEIRPNLFYADKANVWTWDNKRFAVAGGAYSIDRYSRTPQVDWWPQEQFNVQDLIKVRNFGRVDYLFSHDAPTSILATWLKKDVESHLHRQMMNRVGEVLRPRLWFHGHYHWFSGEYGFNHPDGMSSVYSLDADFMASIHGAWTNHIQKHVIILDTEEDEVMMIAERK